LPEVSVARLAKLFILRKPFYPRDGGWISQIQSQKLGIPSMLSF
jgi:hypothetical protein